MIIALFYLQLQQPRQQRRSLSRTRSLSRRRGRQPPRLRGRHRQVRWRVGEGTWDLLFAADPKRLAVESGLLFILHYAQLPPAPRRRLSLSRVRAPPPRPPRLLRQARVSERVDGDSHHGCKSGTACVIFACDFPCATSTTIPCSQPHPAPRRRHGLSRARSPSRRPPHRPPRVPGR